MMGDSQSRQLQPKKNPITDEYKITNSVLGLGINGKVVECFSRATGDKFALKVGVVETEPLHFVKTVSANMDDLSRLRQCLLKHYQYFYLFKPFVFEQIDACQY